MTTTSSPPRIGVLGGPGTFTFQATERLLSAYPELGENRSYYSSVDGVWDSLAGGEVDVIIVMEQTSKFGWNLSRERVAPAGASRFVSANVTVPYDCSLLVKPGTKLADLDAVWGHDSLRLCSAWFEEHLPGVPRSVHPLNSVEAAREVAAGDGTKGVVATMLTAELTGLEPLARGIDAGAAGSWWAVGSEPLFPDEPDAWLVRRRIGQDPELGRFLTELRDAGLEVVSVSSHPTGQMHVYDYVIQLAGPGQLGAISDLVTAHGGELAGAWQKRS
jgi:prephenate dehydratase